MKKQLITIVFIVLCVSTSFGQRIFVSLVNVRNTNESGTHYYNADVYIRTDTPFKLGAGQFYLNYNRAAFGEKIVENNNVQYLRPTGSILAQTNGFPTYTNFVINDNFNASLSRFAVAYRQGVSAGTMTANNVTTVPRHLCSIKMKYADVSQAPSVTFALRSAEGVSFTNQFYTACGPNSGQGFSACDTHPGTQITNATFNSKGATPDPDRVTWFGSSGTDWKTSGNWRSTGTTPGAGAPTTTSNVYILKSQNNPRLDADRSINVRSLTVDPEANMIVTKTGSIQLTGNMDNSGTITLQSDNASSSVLLVKGTSTGTVTYERGGFKAPNNGVLEWSIVSPPVAGQTISSFVNTASNMIAKNSGNTHWAVAKFDYSRSAGQHWRYYTVEELNPSTGSKRTETFKIGESYAMARTAEGSVQFTGTIEVANVNKSVAADSWNTLGNPFAAFIPSASGTGDDNNFVKDNESVFRTQNTAVYIWKNLANTTAQSGAARYEAVPLSRISSLAPGQGFIIRTKPSGTSQSVTFTQTRRTTQPATESGFSRKSNTVPRIELKATLDGLTIHTDVEYFKDFTLGLDPGYDVAEFGPDRFDLYTKLLDGYQGENFEIQALPANNYQNMVIPVGLIADSGSQLTFSAEVLNLPAGIEAYLEDRALGTFTNLSKQNGSYMVTLNTKVNGHGRFYLRTMSSSLSNGDNPELSGVKVYTTDASTLMIQGIDSEEARMEMYSVIGTQVFDTKFRGTGVNQIKLPNLAAGIYIVRLATGKGTIQKKIVLE